MRLPLVSIITVAFAAVACSDATRPLSRPGFRAQTQPDSSIPILPGVRVDTLLDSRYSLTGINNAGEIVGAFQPNDSVPPEAFRLQGGHLTFLSLPEQLVMGTVNDEGDVVTSFGFTQAAVWNVGGQVVTLASPFPDSGTVCLDNAINNPRTVIGLCQTANGTFYPTEWIAEGRPQILTANGGVSLVGALPEGLNNVGAIAGTTVSSAAFVLLPNHDIRFQPQGLVSWAVNDAGWVAGQTAGPAVWTPSDSLILIASSGQMLAINQLNVAAGWFSNGTCGGESAIIWKRSIGARQLPCVAPGSFEDDVATGINDQGEVIGGALVFGKNGGTTSYNVLWRLPPGW